MEQKYTLMWVWPGAAWRRVPDLGDVPTLKPADFGRRVPEPRGVDCVGWPPNNVDAPV